MILSGIEQSKFDSFSAIMEHISETDGIELLFAREIKQNETEDEPEDNKDIQASPE